VYIAILAEICI